MPTYTITKKIEVSIDIEADNPQEAFEIQLGIDDAGPDFSLVDCQYTVYDADNNDITGEVYIK